MQKVLEISVFFPAYNEEENIRTTVLKTKKVLEGLADTWEIVVVDDGSNDKTAAIVVDLEKKDKKIRLVSHQTNRGYGAAIKTGLKSCRYKLVLQMDSDGQFDPGELENFLPKLETADLVIGFRKKRTDSFYRRILQKTLWLADWILFGLNVRDVDCGFKVIKKKVIEQIGELKTESAITVTELIVRAKQKGFEIAQIGVNHHARQGGEQTGGKLKIVFKAAYEGIMLWWLLKIK